LPHVRATVAAAEQVAARFRPGQLVILESTTYPRTTEELLLPLFQRVFAGLAIALKSLYVGEARHTGVQTK